jgi:hypothetical protein
MVRATPAAEGKANYRLRCGLHKKRFCGYEPGEGPLCNNRSLLWK